MRALIASTAAFLLTLPGAFGPAERLVTLHDLVSPADPLARHDLAFDPRFARMAVEYVRNNDRSMLDRLAKQPAAVHLLNHARQFDYDVPKDSTMSLVRHLLAPSPELRGQADQVEQSLAFFTGPMLADPQWVNDVLAYLPSSFRFRGSLFLTFGYDSGVALAPNASLNGANWRFHGKPRELLYYAIHELHHVGVNTYQPPPRIADLRTCADVLRLVDYSTELEGMAVHVARLRRAAEGALDADADYVALASSDTMRALEQKYDEQYEYLRKRGAEPADKAAMAVIEQMSSGDRLWYRVGALMSARIEERLGRAALVKIAGGDHPTLVETYRGLRRSS